MNYLSIESISKSYGPKILFNNISFGILQGEKVAFIAKNGSGKSTLLSIIAGLEKADTGNVSINKEIKLSYLAQSEDIEKHKRIIDYIFQNIENKEKIINFFESNENQHIADELKEIHLWQKISIAQKLINEFGFDNIFSEYSHFSGGEKKKLGIIRIFVEEPDFLLLDEPTNHLDYDMIEWLENNLSNSKFTLLIITHDRYFLENVCDRIIELDNEEIYSYDGNFSYYLLKRAERYEILQSTIDKANSLMKKELDWIRRQPKARGTKQKARIDNFDELSSVANQRIANNELEFVIENKRIGSKILEFHNVGKIIGNRKLFKNFSYKFQQKDKIGIIGKNGVGKTTLIKMILGEDSITDGKIVVGDTIEFAYFSQSNENLDENKRVIEIITEIADFIPLTKGRKLTALQLLLKFNFDKNKHYQYIHTLSGGEKKRLLLLRMLMKNPNFLILDEPTNDLDIFTIQALEDFLTMFEGNMIVVSHDRYFIDKMCNNIIYINQNSDIDIFIGNYSYNMDKIKENPNVKTNENSTKNELEIPKANNYEANKKIKSIENKIQKLELIVSEISIKLNNTNDYDMIVKLSNEMEDVKNQIDTQTEEWLNLQN